MDTLTLTICNVSAFYYLTLDLTGMSTTTYKRLEVDDPDLMAGPKKSGV